MTQKEEQAFRTVQDYLVKRKGELSEELKKVEKELGEVQEKLQKLHVFEREVILAMEALPEVANLIKEKLSNGSDTTKDIKNSEQSEQSGSQVQEVFSGVDEKQDGLSIG